jgi:selenocysteine-specific elongation factor
MILGTAGHIDHGKTTLVRALTGVDTDRLPEEKQRGITIELGFAPLALEGVGTVGVVDVPGHEAFVRTMVAGATGIDVALLVVAADEGVMPQTREHLAILELLGIRRGVIALTKADLVDADWLALVEEDVRDASGRALPEAPILPVSAISGAGIDALRERLRAMFSEVAAVSSDRDDDLFRLPVDRAFTIRGTGTVVTGTVWSGRLARDATVRVLPSDRSARVRGIQVHGGAVDAAEAGARAAIALANLAVDEVPRGSTLVTHPHWRPTSLVRADVTLARDSEFSVRPRTRVRFHVGTSEVGARIVAREVASDAPFAARIVLDEPVVLRAGDRFVIRTSAPLNTVAGGVVTDPYAPRRAAFWRPNLSVAERLDALVIEAGSVGLDVRDLPVRLGVSPSEARQLAADETTGNTLVGERVFRAERVDELRRRIAEAVAAHHAEHPLDVGIAPPLLRARVGAPQVLVDAIVAAEIERGRLVSHGAAIANAGWTPSLDATQREVVERILGILAEAGAEPPAASELATRIEAPIEPLLRFLERRGDIVPTEEGRYYTRDALHGLVERLRAFLTAGGDSSPAAIRDGLGLSRKFLMPFLEYCDRAGYTDRRPDGRVWRSGA